MIANHFLRSELYNICKYAFLYFNKKIFQVDALQDNDSLLVLIEDFIDIF